ncbi:MAG: aminomethyl-transferring glycine dehydrogenase subunit GcvPB, partial [Candidatus Zixiibacteriota bacterium]
MKQPAAIDNGKLIYEKSKAGRIGFNLPELISEEAAVLAAIPGKHRRSIDAALPEVTEPEAMRHFVNLSVKNHHIDKGFYPLGSCTMKYNPKLNDAAAALSGIKNAHPLTPQNASIGLLNIMWTLSEYLKEVSGFKGLSLQPVAGAAGEFAGLLIMRKHHQSRNENRTKIIIPDSAHGTNPATVSAVGFTTVQISANEKGVISPQAVAEVMDEHVAGLMTTNPNTLGIFESHVKEIAEIVHCKGGLMYMDGANLNAHMGIFRPGDVGFDMMHFNLHKTFSTPHGGGGPGAGPVAVKKFLEPFLPAPLAEQSADGTYHLNYD